MKNLFYLLIFGLFISSCSLYTDDEFQAMKLQREHYILYLESSHRDVLDLYRTLFDLQHAELKLLKLQLMKCH